MHEVTKTVVADPKTLPPALLRSTETAAFLGLSIATFRRKLSAGHIGPKAILIGAAQRFSRIELECWISKSCPPRNAWSWPVEESLAP